MEKKIIFFSLSHKKEFFALLCIIFLHISCSKEYSYEGGFIVEPISIFTTQVHDNQTLNDKMGGIEVGVKFRSAIDGKVVGIKFYKSLRNVGVHTVQLYSDYGAPLATVISENETDTGWQKVYFPSAVPIIANKTYLAAYHSSLGNYSATFFGLKDSITNGPLTALADSTQGPNGVFKYTNTPDFPIFGFQSDNYWVDVMVSY